MHERWGPDLKRVARRTLSILILLAAFVVAFVLRYEFAVPADVWRRVVVAAPVVVVVKFGLILAFGAHRHSWRYTSLVDVVRLAAATTSAAAVLLAARLSAPALVDELAAAEYALIPIGVIVIDLAMSTLGLAGVRLLRRLQAEAHESRALGRRRGQPHRVVLVGAGRAGIQVATDLRRRPDLAMQVLGFVDDDPHKRRAVIAGYPVLGTTHDLPAVARTVPVDEAIISIANLSGGEVRRLQDLCRDADLPTKIIPGLHEIVGGKVAIERIRPVAIEDLLGREPVELDLSSIAGLIQGKAVLVTGAGGSIGSELCRQLARFDPQVIVLFEQAETSLWAIHRELEATFPQAELRPVIGDICDEQRVISVLAAEAPQVVFHAAAHKHVPMMEWNPGEAVKNNVLGTRTVVDACVTQEVETFVLISTDKAVNPTSVMGATKRLAERYVQHVAYETGLRYLSVRFGNVLGSTGSVVPIFREQIAAGGPVTVTHPEVTRYFMTIPEATQLVLQAATLGRPGEVLALDMGEPIRIADLAETLIRLSGKEPHVDIEIVYTGIRPGEKLYEELSLDQERAQRTRHPKVWIGHTQGPGWDEAANDLGILARAVHVDGATELRTRLHDLIPEPQVNGTPVAASRLPLAETEASAGADT